MSLHYVKALRKLKLLHPRLMKSVSKYSILACKYNKVIYERVFLMIHTSCHTDAYTLSGVGKAFKNF